MHTYATICKKNKLKLLHNGEPSAVRDSLIIPKSQVAFRKGKTTTKSVVKLVQSGPIPTEPAPVVNTSLVELIS